MTSSEARNRVLEKWYNLVENGQIKLPRFQRFEAWDQHRIAGLLNAIVNNLPAGITLLLEVGDKPQFKDRFISSAEVENPDRLLEHLLDGQQRLTALWRVLNNNYENETYYIYIPEYDQSPSEPNEENIVTFCQSRYFKKNQKRYPLWADDPKECLHRGLVPTHLFRPVDIGEEIDAWIDAATSELKEKSKSEDKLEEYYQYREKLKSRINEIRNTIRNFNLPFLSLPSSTDKEVALQVFINLNTNSKPLSLYDLVVAEVEAVTGKSMHDMQEKLEEDLPQLSLYSNTGDMILYTEALLQKKLPNMRGIATLDKEHLIENWDVMARCLERMTGFLSVNGIHNEKLLPTNAVLAVIAACYSLIPEAGDELGKGEQLLKKYLWSSFYTDRYDNSAATHAFADYNGLRKILERNDHPDSDEFIASFVPVLNRDDYPLADIEKLKRAPWPKRRTIIGRAIIATASYFKSLDFADGQAISSKNFENRHYHHIYPDALLEEAGVKNAFIALNCSIITGKTNLNISRKDPFKYIQERMNFAQRDVIENRLQSHLIPMNELEVGNYEGINESDKTVKVEQDYDAFITARAEIISEAAKTLCDGKDISSAQIQKAA